MRKVAVLFLVVTSIFLIAACSNNTETTPTPVASEISTIDETPYEDVFTNDDEDSYSDTDTSEDYVYVGSINSDKYHYPSCRWAKKIYPENEIWFSSETEAEDAGYKPCKVCQP